MQTLCAVQMCSKLYDHDATFMNSRCLLKALGTVVSRISSKWHAIMQAVATTEKTARGKAEDEVRHLASTLADTAGALDASAARNGHLLVCPLKHRIPTTDHHERCGRFLYESPGITVCIACVTCIDAAERALAWDPERDQLQGRVRSMDAHPRYDATMQAIASDLAAEKEAAEAEMSGLASSLADMVADLTASQAEVVSLRRARSSNLAQVRSRLPMLPGI